MKKIVLLFMSAMALSLAISCNKDNSTDDYKSGIVGTWKIDRLFLNDYDSEGNLIDEYHYVSWEEEDIAQYWIFNDDNTGSFVKTYLFEGDTHNESFTYFIIGNSLIINQESYQIEKLTKKELNFSGRGNYSDGGFWEGLYYLMRVNSISD